MNVDKIDIRRERLIPEIPRNERDMYTLLYEELTVPSHNTRCTTHSQRQRGGSIASTSAEAEDHDPTLSSSEADSHELEETHDSSMDDLDE